MIALRHRVLQGEDRVCAAPVNQALDQLARVEFLIVGGKPVAVNAKSYMTRVANERGWPQMAFQTLPATARAA